MAKIKIHAGDFPKGDAAMHFGQIALPWGGKTLALDELEEIDVASEESVKRIGGTVGWGTAGAVLLGPVGLLAGLLLGGKKTEVTFVAKFKDGRRMLGTTDSKAYKKMMMAVFK